MSTFYKILHDGTEDDNFPIASVVELKSGRQELSHGGVKLTFEITEDDQITVFLSNTEGDLGSAGIDLTGNLDWEKFSNLLDRGVKTVTLQPQDGKEVLSIYGGETYVELKRFSHLPEEYRQHLGKER